MKDHPRLCLNVAEVKLKMKNKGISIKKLAYEINRNEHTVSRYFRNPDKVNLEDITAIADALEMNDLEYDSLVKKALTIEDYEKIRQK